LLEFRMSATIKLYLPSGDPTRLRTADISNWSGRAIAAPRTELEDLLERRELATAGVYILTGFDSQTNEPMAYIGEAEVVRDRLPSHRQLEFWINAVVFISKDDHLTKAHVRYLEGRLIRQAQGTHRYKLHNSHASGARLPESEQADADVFFEKIQQLLPVLGIDMLMPIVPQFSPPERREISSVIRQPERAQPLLYFRHRGLVARGKRTPSGFVVFQNSHAVLADSPSLPRQNPAYATLRATLLREAALIEEGNALRFTRDVEFKSPSAAAVAICGRAANGLISWKNENGKTLKELEAELEI
jgi:hypothetical protein